MRSLGCFLSSCREVTTNRNDRRLLNAILRLACSQFNAIEGERDREMAGSGVFDACQFESELSIPVIVTASTAVTFNTLLDIGENRRLKPAIFAAFFTFSVKLFEFADSNEVG